MPPNTTFHEQQMEMAKRIASAFTSGDSDKVYAILLAQMQSGKSGTYLFLALECVHRRFFGCEKVYIISGSRDTSLRDQTKQNLKEAIRVYCQIMDDLWREDHADELVSLPESIREAATRAGCCGVTKKQLRKRVKVYWNQDLAKLDKTIENCLIVNDESHFAQAKTNRPFQDFWLKNGIDKCLHGDFSALLEKNIRVLSVSATPFSECIQNQKTHLGMLSNSALKEKHFFLMKPGEGYNGVGSFLEKKKLHFESESINGASQKHIRQMLALPKYDNKYCLVRTQAAGKDQEIMECIANDLEMVYKPVFGGNGGDAFDFLNNVVPTCKTLVHICGKARMGQVLKKTYIGMVYEQSTNPNVDTVLQGLLGRMCGYDTNGDIDIYLPASREDDIIKYVDSVNSIPDVCCAMIAETSPATCVGKVGKTHGEFVSDRDGQIWRKMIPMKFKLSDLEKGFDGNTTFEDIKALDRGDLKNLLVNLFEDKPELFNQNPDFEFVQKILRDPNFNSRIIFRNFSKPSYRKNKRKAMLNASFLENSRDTAHFTKHGIFSKKTSTAIPFNLVGGGDPKLDGDVTEVFLTGFSIYEGHVPVSMPDVHKNCNFTDFEFVNESNPTVPDDSGQLIKFPQETSEDKVLFRKKLKAAIYRTKPNHSSFISDSLSEIQSNWCGQGKQYNGLLFSKKIFTEDKLNSIKKKLEKRCGVKINFVKGQGRQPTDFIKYKSINWSIVE